MHRRVQCRLPAGHPRNEDKLQVRLSASCCGGILAWMRVRAGSARATGQVLTMLYHSLGEALRASGELGLA